jgi:hypothetical protein
MLIKKLSIFFIFTAVCLIDASGQGAPDIIDLRIFFNDTIDIPLYEVYMKSDNDVSPAIIGSTQISIAIPSEAVFGVLNSGMITSIYPVDWAVTASIESPISNDTFDYYAVATQGGFYTPGITEDEEVLLFTFSLDDGCIDGIRLFDQFRDPTSSEMEDGGDYNNSVVLQTSQGVIEAYDYLYGDLEPSCSNLYDCSEDHLLFTFEDLPSGSYHAIQTITASNTILNGTMVEFIAGLSITLVENFEVQLGQVFSATIEPCSN